ncbi:MAG: carbohydrate kinase family protein [Acidobacteriota bacterium]
MGGVLVCGNIVADVLVRPVDRVAWGTSTWVESIEQHMGGNGANTSYAAAKLGAPVRLLSAVGLDEFGDQMLARLRSAGVDVGQVSRGEAATPASVVVVNSAGDRALLHLVGASAAAFPEPLEFDARLAAGMSAFHLANLFALPLVRRHAAATMRRARAAGLTTSLDTGWDSRGRWLEDLAPCLPYTDLMFVNLDEARELTGQAEPAAAAARLRELGAAAVVVKLGARGSVVFTAGGVAAAPAFAVEAVDTTGAGDCFAGAFLAARHRGLSLEECARIANAAAALAIQKLGATGGLRSWEETVEWAAAHPLASPPSGGTNTQGGPGI